VGIAAITLSTPSSTASGRSQVTMATVLMAGGLGSVSAP